MFWNLFTSRLKTQSCVDKKTILEGMVDGKRSKGRPEKSWMTNTIEWAGTRAVDMNKLAQDRAAWKTIDGSKVVVPPPLDG